MTILQPVCNIGKYYLQIIIQNLKISDSTSFILIMTILQPVCNMDKYCLRIIILKFNAISPLFVVSCWNWVPF